VVEGSVDGLSMPVGGTWRRKRAAEAVDANEANVVIESCMVNVVNKVEVVVVVRAKGMIATSSFGETWRRPE